MQVRLDFLPKAAQEELRKAKQKGIKSTAKEEAASYEKAAAEEKLEGMRQDRLHRKELGKQLLMLVQGWLIGVFMILLWEGFSAKIGIFHLPDSVLNTLLVTTTANVIGLLVIVARYLYSEKRL